MITEKSIHRFCSITLIVCSVAAFAVSFYFSRWHTLVWTLIVAIFIFAMSFIMEWFHVSISDPILWLSARFASRKAKHKIERFER
jgi:c-di-AMP phosphodiesterase-like protein